MAVNSIDFLLFFAVVFIVYYLPFVKNRPKLQTAWLLAANVAFYAIAELKMLPLLLGVVLVYYYIGLLLKTEMMKRNAKRASVITTVGVTLGILLLFYFKYLNFFVESFASLLSGIGLNATWTTLNVVLPLGVSFFTFKLISYVIEIHREHIEPCRSLTDFAAYVTFFPTIMAGPIDRPNGFIPQMGKGRSLDYHLAVDGLRQILWGMFTKMCIADNLAQSTDFVWNDVGGQTPSTLLYVALLFPVQMYADFDGYSNMAIGVGKLLGFRITRNFNHPFLARNVADYWLRWHISLTSFITDYVFMPLNIAFRDKGKLGISLAVVINLVVIGLWHGANWTYAMFGLYHGLLFLPLVYANKFGRMKKLKANKIGLPKMADFIQMVLTYGLVAIGLIIFMAPSLSSLSAFVNGLFSKSILSFPHPHLGQASSYVSTYLFVVVLFVMEWWSRDKEYALQQVFPRSRVLRWATYYAVLLSVYFFAAANQEFIYVRF